MAKLYYQGHGSLRIQAADGRVIYIDPYAGDGYDLLADIVLVTHQHGDHNQLKLVNMKPGCVVIDNAAALEDGTYRSFDIDGVTVRAVPAGNKNHDPSVCVGYVITLDGVKLYIAGDTSKTAAMADLTVENLDYAFLPCDGVYNMDLEEAAECAAIIKARHSVPIHMKPGELFDMERAKAYPAPDKLIIEPGREIELVPSGK